MCGHCEAQPTNHHLFARTNLYYWVTNVRAIRPENRKLSLYPIQRYWGKQRKLIQTSTADFNNKKNKNNMQPHKL